MTLQTRAWYLVVVVALAVRFVNLGAKPLWFDETITALRISGHTERSLQAALSRAPVEITTADLLKYQKPQPETSTRDVVLGLAREEPQHQPLYYVVLRWLVRLIGSTPAKLRACSSLLALCSLPAALWLCREVFGARYRLSFVLYALSPLQLIFARTAREYGLWVGAALAASAALLCALRSGTTRAVVVYGLLFALCAQVHVLAWLLLLGHLVFLALYRGDASHGGTFVRRCWTAALVGCASSLPWLLLTRGGETEGTHNWALRAREPADMARAWGAELVRSFVDYNAQGDSAAGWRALLLLAAALLAYVILGEAWALLKNRDRPALLLVCLAMAHWVPLLGVDLLVGGQVSAVSRYQAVALAASTLLVGGALSTGTWARRAWSRWAGGMIGAVELGSCVHMVASSSWWHKAPNNVATSVAAATRQTEPKSVIVFDGWAGDAFSLAWLTPEDQPWLVRVTPFQDADTELRQHTPTSRLRDEVSLFYFDPRGYITGAFRDWSQQASNSGRARPVVQRADQVVLWRISPETPAPKGN